MRQFQNCVWVCGCELEVCISGFVFCICSFVFYNYRFWLCPYDCVCLVCIFVFVYCGLGLVWMSRCVVLAALARARGRSKNGLREGSRVALPKRGKFTSARSQKGRSSLRQHPVGARRRSKPLYQACKGTGATMCTIRLRR